MSNADDEVYDQPIQVGSKLVTEPDEEILFTSRRETDCWNALNRGLAEYVAGLSIDWPGGTHLRLLKVFQGWAEPESFSKYPSASVYSESPGEYDGDSFSTFQQQLPDGRSIQRIAEFVQTYNVDIWCTNPHERMGLVAMLEDALDPVGWMSGFRLTLPHYHGAVATYLKQTLTIADSSENAGRRWRLASFSITGSVSQIRFVGAVPTLDIRVQAEVADA
jgi:hypothetical protein